MSGRWKGLLPIEGEVIVIEDDPLMRSSMMYIVEEIGSIACAFETADDALQYLLHVHGRCSLGIVEHGVPGQIQEIKFIELMKSRWPSISAILTSGICCPQALPAFTVHLH